MKRDWVLLVLVAAIGCGEEKKAPPTRGGETPEDGDASISWNRDSGMRSEMDAEVSMMSDGPVLSFTSPAAASSPNDDAVWVQPMIMVRCKATPRSSTAKVDASSIKLTMEKIGSDSTEMVVGAVDAEGDEFQAIFDVSGQPNGVLRFHCSAKDLAMTPKTSAITLETYLDLGPTIEIVEPKRPEYALRLPVAMEFKVNPAPVAEGDEKAAVKSVKLEVSGLEIPVTEAVDEPGVYRTPVDFQDRVRFPVTPSSAEVRVTASSSRTPVAAVRTTKRDIRIDADGPTIIVDEPVHSTIAHGSETLQFRVTDPSGVQEGSVVARFEDVKKIAEGGGDLIYDQWNVNMTTYSQQFDTGNFEPTVNQVTLQIVATDKVGNTGKADHVFYIDNVPPVLDMDPPPLREFRRVNNKNYCSELFDPVGGDAMDDLAQAESYALFRVLIEDDTNHKPDQNVQYEAGVNRDSVKLWAQGDPSLPFLIDTNEDGVCDDIKMDEIDPVPTQLQLKPLTPRGTAWYPKMLSTSVVACEAADSSGADNPPDPLCPATTMTRAVPGRVEGAPPAVYGFNPSNTNMGECQGREWFVGNIVGEGWACFAVRAEDNKGNVGVSPPIRICFDANDGTPQPCKTMGATDPDLPSCMHNCTAPPSYGTNPMIWRQH